MAISNQSISVQNMNSTIDEPEMTDSTEKNSSKGRIHPKEK